MSSLAILAQGKAPQWKMDLFNDAMQHKDDGRVYQQSGVGVQVCVIHTCKNLGQPFDSARHRAAKAVWNEINRIPAKPGKQRRAEYIKDLVIVWDITE